MQNTYWYATNPYQAVPNYGYFRSYPAYPYYMDDRQQHVRGQATWTEGGQVTHCGIPWSEYDYMTAAVGGDTPYHCGQTLKIRNLSIPAREVLVTVVDQVPGYPANKINLHRRAFEALGGNPNEGVMNIEIMPSPELEQQEWGKYLLEVVQVSYPGYNIVEYNALRKTQLGSTRRKETYEYILESPQEQLTIHGNVIYDKNTDRIVSLDIKEIHE